MSKDSEIALLKSQVENLYEVIKSLNGLKKVNPSGDNTLDINHLLKLTNEMLDDRQKQIKNLQ